MDAGSMRALWSGVIQFGLVVLPVKLFSATEEHQVRLREIHAAPLHRSPTSTYAEKTASAESTTNTNMPPELHGWGFRQAHH